MCRSAFCPKKCQHLVEDSRDQIANHPVSRHFPFWATGVKKFLTVFVANQQAAGGDVHLQALTHTNTDKTERQECRWTEASKNNTETLREVRWISQRSHSITADSWLNDSRSHRTDPRTVNTPICSKNKRSWKNARLLIFMEDKNVLNLKWFCFTVTLLLEPSAANCLG